MVGKKHTVDLNKPDLVILVEVYTVGQPRPLQAKKDEAN